MRTLILFEDEGYAGLLPLVYWRAVAELRCGRFSLLDRFAHYLRTPIRGLWVRDWIAPVAAERCQLPTNARVDGPTVLINARCLPHRELKFEPAPFVARRNGQIVYIACDETSAARLTPAVMLDPEARSAAVADLPGGEVELDTFSYVWDLVSRNTAQLVEDWTADDRAMEGRVSTSAAVLEPDSIHIGQRSEVEPTAVIDARTGPVFISEGARIGSHSCICGPAYIGPGSAVNPHTYIHGGTTIGPICRVGGEINGCIVCGYTNKQHEGFLGRAYVGCWANIGASTVNSDLKNTYGNVRVPLNGREIDTGLTFFGAIIADHAKLGIQQALPTGAVLGFGANVATSSLCPKFTPSFAWLTDAGQVEADPERLLATAQRMMQRRNVTCSAAESALFLDLARRAREYEAG